MPMPEPTPDDPDAPEAIEGHNTPRRREAYIGPRPTPDEAVPDLIE